MNIALWTVQVLWGVFFSLTGFGKVLCNKPALRNQRSMKCLGFPRVPAQGGSKSLIMQLIGLKPGGSDCLALRSRETT